MNDQQRRQAFQHGFEHRQVLGDGIAWDRDANVEVAFILADLLIDAANVTMRLPRFSDKRDRAARSPPAHRP
jgi:hypothetical protein